MKELIIVVGAIIGTGAISSLIPNPHVDAIIYQLAFFVFALMWQNESYKNN